MFQFNTIFEERAAIRGFLSRPNLPPRTRTCIYIYTRKPMFYIKCLVYFFTRGLNRSFFTRFHKSQPARR